MEKPKFIPTPPQAPKQEKERTTAHEIFVNHKFWGDIDRGDKTLELRVKGTNSIPENVQVGDTITFKKGNGQGVTVEVTGVREYASFDAVLQQEDTQALAPGFGDRQIAQAKQRMFPDDLVKRKGLILFEFRKVEE